MPPVQVRAAGLAYVRSTRAWQLAENQRAPWKSAIFSVGWARGATRSVKSRRARGETAEREKRGLLAYTDEDARIFSLYTHVTRYSVLGSRKPVR